MAKLNIKKGDKVVVLTGTDKGQKGKVILAMPQKDKVLVEGVRQVKRHQKPSQQYPTGGIVQKEAPIHASNVRLICPKCEKAIAAKRVRLDNGKWMRQCPECNEKYE